MRSGRWLALTGVVGLLGGAGLVATPASAGARQIVLFRSDNPGSVPGAAEVPEGICFVTITASGGSGGDFFPTVDDSIGSQGGSGASVTARFAVAPGDILDALVA